MIVEYINTNAHLEMKLALQREYIERLETIIKNVLSGEYPRDRDKKCNHEKYSWEDCEQCIDDYLHIELQKALASKPKDIV